MSSELKACPWCGGKASMAGHDRQPRRGWGYTEEVFFVRCDECNRIGCQCVSAAAAAEDWNARAPCGECKKRRQEKNKMTVELYARLDDKDEEIKRALKKGGE